LVISSLHSFSCDPRLIRIFLDLEKAYDRVPIPSFTTAPTSTIDDTSESLSHYHLLRAIEELRKREVELENELSTTRAKRRRLEEVLE
jgi:hypothetical protein